MDSSGRLFAPGQPAPLSRLNRLHDELSAMGFHGCEELPATDLAALIALHERRLDYLREERRMHFGAFALAALGFVILLGPLTAGGDAFVPLALAEGLLFALLVPYVFVYRRFEENVRRMMREAGRLENALHLALEREPTRTTL